MVLKSIKKIHKEELLFTMPHKWQKLDAFLIFFKRKHLQIYLIHIKRHLLIWVHKKLKRLLALIGRQKELSLKMNKRKREVN